MQREALRMSEPEFEIPPPLVVHVVPKSLEQVTVLEIRVVLATLMSKL